MGSVSMFLGRSMFNFVVIILVGDRLMNLINALINHIGLVIVSNMELRESRHARLFGI